MSLLLTKTAPVDLLLLTTEMKAAVPSLEGLGDLGAEVEVRRAGGGAFTLQEAAALTQVFSAHDASVATARRQRREQEARKDPKTLTEKERLTRLEVLLGVE